MVSRRLSSTSETKTTPAAPPAMVPAALCSPLFTVRPTLAWDTTKALMPDHQTFSAWSQMAMSTARVQAKEPRRAALAWGGLAGEAPQLGPQGLHDLAVYFSKGHASNSR